MKNTEMENAIRKLMLVEKEKLVSTLLDLSYRYEGVANAVERLISTKDTNVERFKAKLLAYQGNGRSFSWNETHRLVSEIEDLLSDIKEGASDPREGVEFLKLFFEAEQDIIHSGDDSSGNIGDVFRYSATELFEHYASQCSDKDWVGDVLFELITENDYGLRDNLTDNIGRYLPEKNIRCLVDKLWELHLQSKMNNQSVTGGIILMLAMAKGLKDPVLFERIVNEEGGGNDDYDASRIGAMWLECGHPQKALSFLEKVSKSSHRYLGDIDKLLLQAYALTGNSDKQKDTAWTIFRSYRAKENFESVVQLEGNKKWDELLKKEVNIISQDKEMICQNVDFLLEMKQFDEGEKYILERKNDLNGSFYGTLADWAEAFGDDKRFLVATLIYRSLLDSILKRGYAKAYHHGVDYLKKLDEYSEKIKDWQGNSRHGAYFEQVKLNHKRKISFWSQYKSGRK
jgi:hypothetical protein